MKMPPPTPFKQDNPFANPETAARKLVEIVRDFQAKRDEPHTYTGVVNTAFTGAGGTVESYMAGRDYAIEKGWLAIDGSGTRISVLPDAP